MMTAAEIENALGIKAATLRQWVCRGHVPRPMLLGRQFALYNPWAVVAHVLRKEIQ